MLPKDIQADIDKLYSYDNDSYYKDRAHAYIKMNNTPRVPGDTAQLAVANDIARRCYEAGVKDGQREVGPELAAEFLELAAKCTRIAGKVG